MTVESLELYVAIDPNLPSELTSPAVAFGSFEAKHPGVVVYDSVNDAENLTGFYLDLICGRPLPLQFVTREITSVVSLVALALFMDRALALSPNAMTLISAATVAYTLKEGGLAHVERDLARLLLFVDQYYFAEPLTKKTTERKLSQVLDWLRTWVLWGRIPSMGKEPVPPRVLDRGTNGFVIAEMDAQDLVSGVVELYRGGYLRGYLWAPGGHVLAFKKSRYLQFDLDNAAMRLNLLEPGWAVQRHLLTSPEKGTQIRRETLTEIFLRV